MVLKAIGKLIDTLPINDLFSQEEVLADTIVIEIGRFYNERDLADFTFFMRGVTESGGETQTELTAETGEDTIQLFWDVNGDFTAEAGRLSLDLYGCCYAADADPAAEPPEAIIRYQLPPVQVRGLPESEGILDSHSYTEFLLEVKAAANDAIAMIEQKAAEFEEKYPDYAEMLSQVNEALAAQDNTIKALSMTVEDLSTRLQQLEERTAVMTPITAITQSEFDALEAPDEGTLYVITN